MNEIANVLNKIGNGKLKFIPNPNFYKTVGIGRKRWGQIYRNEKSATLDELSQIAKYFGVSINDLIESKPFKVS